MIDIHHHCVPGVDDGPREFAEAVALCRAAAADGITTIVATPHVLRGSWQNDEPALIEAAVARLNDELKGSPHVLTGSEYYFAHDAVEKLLEGAVPFLAGSRYFLVEFASNIVPPMVEQVIHRMRVNEWVPIIAHPERNQVFVAKEELLWRLVELGAKLQITAGSLLGDFGKRAQSAACKWLNAEMVHFIATDAHNMTKRPPVLGAAFRMVAKEQGEKRARALMLENPGAVISNQALPYDPIHRPPRSRPGFFSRLSRVLKQY